MTQTATYTIKGAQVTLESGVTVIVETDSIEGVKRFLDEVRTAKLGQPPPPAPPETVQTERLPDDPIARMETHLGLQSGALARANVVAVKDDVPQLMRPSTFKATDAVVTLLFTVERGLGQHRIDYEAFKGLYEAQNLKAGSPLAMILTNLRNQGYLDRKAYADGRKLRLTAKGEQKAMEVIKGVCEA